MPHNLTCVSELSKTYSKTDPKQSVPITYMVARAGRGYDRRGGGVISAEVNKNTTWKMGAVSNTDEKIFLLWHTNWGQYCSNCRT